MTSHTCWITTLAIATLAQLMGGVALAQTSSPAPASNSTDGIPVQVTPATPATTIPSDPNTRSPQAQPLQTQPSPSAQEPVATCPPGQFLSVFSDVRPDHWAYEAVNRIASGEPRCFPLDS
ncbi:hypothetical protein H6G89_04130 [Oscillatoria sp. FACHB-1407]|uniref:hypothetical protein n=1 Tax=Oscillatoria sp. FACHB-1407 TaxID=2692847 RepID=UPI0016886CD9|nr:hypothetical protein [Oscillatoria sp. FACHB-1407]MBD2460225.1 hypothetical protein [Oscillatoria sp. FACHB-1407]